MKGPGASSQPAEVVVGDLLDLGSMQQGNCVPCHTASSRV